MATVSDIITASWALPTTNIIDHVLSVQLEFGKIVSITVGPATWGFVKSNSVSSRTDHDVLLSSEPLKLRVLPNITWTVGASPNWASFTFESPQQAKAALVIF